MEARNIRESIALLLTERAYKINQGRSIIVSARVRNGKLQRRKKISAVPNYAFRKKGGHVLLVRITSQEKLRRKIGARRAKIKRKAKSATIRRKMKMSLRLRRNRGL